MIDFTPSTNEPDQEQIPVQAIETEEPVPTDSQEPVVEPASLDKAIEVFQKVPDTSINGHNNIKFWLEPLLKEKGLSVEDAAKGIGVTRAAVYFWLKDASRPTEEAMIKLCHFLGRPVEEGLSTYTPKKRGPKSKKKA